MANRDNRDGMASGDPVENLKITARGRLATAALRGRRKTDGIFGAMDDSSVLADICQGEPLVNFAHSFRGGMTEDGVDVFSSITGLTKVPTQAGDLDIEDLYTKLRVHFGENTKAANDIVSTLVTNNLVFQGFSAANMEYAHCLKLSKAPVFARKIFGPAQVRVAAQIRPGQFVAFRANVQPSDYTKATAGYADTYQGLPPNKRLVELVPIDMACSASSFIHELNIYLKDPKLALLAHDPRLKGGSSGLAPLELTTQMLAMAGAVFHARLDALSRVVYQFTFGGRGLPRDASTLFTDGTLRLDLQERLSGALAFIQACLLAYTPFDDGLGVGHLDNMVKYQNVLLSAFGVLPYPSSNRAGMTVAETRVYAMLDDPEVRVSMLALRNHLVTLCVHDQNEDELPYNILFNYRPGQNPNVGMTNTAQGYVAEPTKLEGQALTKQITAATDWFATLKHNIILARHQVVGRGTETNQTGFAMIHHY